MSRTRTLTALALAAALASAVPAAAASRAARPRAASPAGAPSLVREALSWLSVVWGAPVRSLSAGDQSTTNPDPGDQTTTAAPKPVRLPSGGGWDPNG
jgi:hypothetical protein